MVVHRVGPEVKIVDFPEPGIFVGCENAVRCAAQGQHLPALEDHMVLEAVKCLAVPRQRLADPRVACQRSGFVIMVGKNGFGGQLLCHRRHDLVRPAVLHDQSGMGHAMVAAQLSQLPVQVHQ